MRALSITCFIFSGLFLVIGIQNSMREIQNPMGNIVGYLLGSSLPIMICFGLGILFNKIANTRRLNQAKDDTERETINE